MKNLITITMEVPDCRPEDSVLKARQGIEKVGDRIATYMEAAYLSVLGPDGISFEPPVGGCSEHGDDAYIRVNIKEVD